MPLVEAQTLPGPAIPVKLWQALSRRLGWLGVAAGLVVMVAAIPLLFVLYSSSQLSLEGWQALWSQRLPGLLGNTLSLAVLVAVGCFALGVSSAWLVARRRFVGRGLASWLMVLPLTIPTYVFAHIYTTLFEADGWLGRTWLAVFGESVAIPELYNIWGVTFILSLAGFSYVFLLVRTALAHSNPNLEEAARIQGARPWQVFWRVNLPLLRPAIAAGLALVVLHVLSDFGAVSMLRYQTFTLSIYLQMNSRFDYQGAAGLSMVLVMLSLMFLVLERFSRRKQRYYASAQQRLAVLRPATALEQVLIWGWLGLITLFAFGLPLAWMLDWSWQAWQQELIDMTFWGYVSNSLIVAAGAATIAMVCAFPVAFFHTRKRSLLSTSYLQLSSIGFVLPGPVIALGVLSFILAVFAPLYGGLAALLMALVVRFLPLAVQSQEASLQQLTPSIEQAGRSLGAGPLENLRRVILPMIRGGMAGAWVLVFIDALKELPATLILRPTGFDTLPVRIWIEASEEMLELAAPAALMLVVGTLPALWLMMRGEKRLE
ncbi:ABC transporter permease [Sulfuriflexus mobilis]|uniref:ABC transporter permease n=1 Tax=Sulfuriflexus mobilis TaxID=1811807 RepID=UPI000F8396DA|nr:iron ABC transporter permease [Sulfuriflexus mobilis]